jgi:DNA-binding NarL/FixJ family response regulator
LFSDHTEFTLTTEDRASLQIWELETQSIDRQLPENLLFLIRESQDMSSIRRIIQQGVRGIVTVHCSEKEILHAARTVAQGDRFFCSRVLDALIDTPENPASLISEREKQVLHLIAKGKTTSEIANELNISIHTVNSHRKNMLKKLNLKSPVQLVTFAIEQQIVVP